jgi:hypothetical protein
MPRQYCLVDHPTLLKYWGSPLARTLRNLLQASPSSVVQICLEMLHAAYSQQETPIGSRNMLGQKVQRDLAFDGIRSLLAAMTFLLRAADRYVYA